MHIGNVAEEVEREMPLNCLINGNTEHSNKDTLTLDIVTYICILSAAC